MKNALKKMENLTKEEDGFIASIKRENDINDSILLNSFQVLRSIQRDEFIKAINKKETRTDKEQLIINKALKIAYIMGTDINSFVLFLCRLNTIAGLNNVFANASSLVDFMDSVLAAERQKRKNNEE